MNVCAQWKIPTPPPVARAGNLSKAVIHLWLLSHVRTASAVVHFTVSKYILVVGHILIHFILQNCKLSGGHTGLKVA